VVLIIIARTVESISEERADSMNIMALALETIDNIALPESETTLYFTKKPKYYLPVRP
jgi:hypothetical protein